MSSSTFAKEDAVASAFCPSCGYDLRATPDCCPECGATPLAKATRMIRRLLNIITVLSLLLCVATCVLWVRSRGFYESISVEFPWHEEVFLLIGSSNGTCLMQFYLHEVVLRHGFDYERVGDTTNWAEYVAKSSDKVATNRLGFVLARHADQRWGDARSWTICFPHWSLLLATSILPVIAIRRRWNRYRRHVRIGCCPTCSYDLRATPDRCPECGTVTSKA
jgi:hypothetical protein